MEEENVHVLVLDVHKESYGRKHKEYQGNLEQIQKL